MKVFLISAWLVVMFAVRHYAHWVVDDYGWFGTISSLAIIFLVANWLDTRAKQSRSS